jgi:signal transduction histidine kinase
VLAAADINANRATGIWCVVVVAYAGLRTIRPLRDSDDATNAIALVAEVALHVFAVVSTGYWTSPFVFSLITAVIVTGFARGFAFSLLVATVSVVSVTTPDYVRNADFDWREAAQWASEMLLIALVAGFARRISGEADRQQSLALDRLGRLADANALLFSLHRVAQSLPASLDLDECLDSTMGRLRDLFDVAAAAVLVLDDTDRGWVVARREGTRLPSRIPMDELPPALAAAVDRRGAVSEPNLLDSGGPGLAPRMYSGIYTVLLARGSVIGLVSLEHSDPGHFTDRDVELLEGFAEPAALALDNARWFGRLRTVGAVEVRTRIARYLHDRIGQSLAYLAFELDRIVKSDGRGDTVGPSLEQLRSDIRDVIREVRDTLYDLRTDVSEEQDFLSVLNLFVQRVQDRAGVDIALRSEQTERLPLVQEREMFRIAQEALANIEKHAEATQVLIDWQCAGHAAVLDISDNGKGFAIGQAGRLDSYGIIGMRERASSIGAMLQIDSDPDVGTRVRCLLGVQPATRSGLRGLRRSGV